MGESVTVECPWCGEAIEVWCERDNAGTQTHDCDVCCRPCTLEIGWDDGPWVVAQRE